MLKSHTQLPILKPTVVLEPWRPRKVRGAGAPATGYRGGSFASVPALIFKRLARVSTRADPRLAIPYACGVSASGGLQISAAIVTEQTSDPDTLQFWVGPARPRGSDGAPVRTWTDAEEAARAWPPAATLLALPGVVRVALGGDFVRVTKDAASDWRSLGRAVLHALRSVLEPSGLPAFPCVSDAVPTAPPRDGDLEACVRALIERDIRPALAADGGDVRLRAVREGIVELELRGACKDCTGARATLRDYIEKRLRAIPGVHGVRAV
jgi:Fe-S cluster biogenesis protein NfuA